MLKKSQNKSQNGSHHATQSIIEHRISVFVNNPDIPQEEYEPTVRAACEIFGRVKLTHVPKNAKRGNLVFAEFYNRR